MKEREHITPIGDEGLYVLDTSKWRNFKPVINRQKCINCGICFTYCPVNSIYKKGEKFFINLSYCKGCGICSNECPKKAIEMVSEGGQV